MKLNIENYANLGLCEWKRWTSSTLLQFTGSVEPHAKMDVQWKCWTGPSSLSIPLRVWILNDQRKPHLNCVSRTGRQIWPTIWSQHCEWQYILALTVIQEGRYYIDWMDDGEGSICKPLANRTTLFVVAAKQLE